MYTPTLRDPGFVELVDGPPDQRFAVWDGQVTGDPRAYGRKERWLVEHLESGRKRFYKTRKEAREDARALVTETDESRHWWKFDEDE
ncbi:hypothetical protein D3C87_1430900 [compost metagenome]